jgi:hypothetical protein
LSSLEKPTTVSAPAKPVHGLAPAPCQPPDTRLACVVGQVNEATARWSKRMRAYCTSPKPATTSATPFFTLKSRLSSALPLPQPGELHLEQGTSAPGHSLVPSPPVKSAAVKGSWAQVSQFIEPEVSSTMSRRGDTSTEVLGGFRSSSSLREWQPGSAG